MVASGVNARIAYKGETTHGITPAGNFTVQRAISRAVNLKKATLESQESSVSRQRRDVRHGFQSVEGEVQVELAMEAYNDWLLWSTGTTAWVTPTTVTAPGTALSVTTSDTFTRGTGDWIDDGYRVGDWIVTSNFTNGGNNGNFRVKSVSAAGLGVHATLTNESGAGTASVAFIGKKAVIGSANQLLKTFSLEREILDLDAAGIDLYQIYKGCAISQLTVSASPEALLEATFRILGILSDINNAAPTASYDAAATNSPFAAIDSAVYIGAATLTTATQFDFTVDNQRSLLPVLGLQTSSDIYEGVAKVSGTVGLLLQNNTYTSFFQNEALGTTGWQLRVNELGTSDFMTFNFYRVKFTTHEMDPPPNGPVVQLANWEALENTLTGTSTTVYKETMHIQRSTTT